MPTVLRVNGFEVMIFLPGREHGPAHVHVFRGGGEVVIYLNEEGEDVAVRGEARNLSFREVNQALAIVDEHASFLREQWRKYHG